MLASRSRLGAQRAGTAPPCPAWALRVATPAVGRHRAGAVVCGPREQLIAALGAAVARPRWSAVCRSSLKQAVADAIDLVDGAKRRRLLALDKLYHGLTKQALEEVLADDFEMGEAGYARRFSKADYIGLMAGAVLPAIPDFSWSAASTGDVADDGYCVVVVNASGHHTGTDLRLPGLEALPPSGKRFCLAEEVQKVKVDASGRVKEVIVLPNKGAGPRAMYAALGGKLPPTDSVDPAAGQAPLP